MSQARFSHQQDFHLPGESATPTLANSWTLVNRMTETNDGSQSSDFTVPGKNDPLLGLNSRELAELTLQKLTTPVH